MSIIKKAEDDILSIKNINFIKRTVTYYIIIVISVSISKFF